MKNKWKAALSLLCLALSLAALPFVCSGGNLDPDVMTAYYGEQANTSEAAMTQEERMLYDLLFGGQTTDENEQERAIP